MSVATARDESACVCGGSRERRRERDSRAISGPLKSVCGGREQRQKAALALLCSPHTHWNVTFSFFCLFENRRSNPGKSGPPEQDRQDRTDSGQSLMSVRARFVVSPFAFHGEFRRSHRLPIHTSSASPPDRSIHLETRGETRAGQPASWSSLSHTWHFIGFSTVSRPGRHTTATFQGQFSPKPRLWHKSEVIPPPTMYCQGNTAMTQVSLCSLSA